MTEKHNRDPNYMKLGSEINYVTKRGNEESYYTYLLCNVEESLRLFNSWELAPKKMHDYDCQSYKDDKDIVEANTLLAS